MSIELHTLPNGLRVVSEPMNGLQSVSVGIWVGTGGRHERLHQNGIAHFLEHMAFKGTGRRTALQIAEQIENVGSEINAYTSREVTAYFARVLEQDLPLAVDILGDIVLDPVFDAREIETERGVILQEIGQVLDTPDDVLFDWLQDAAYPDQPIGRAILGTPERVRSFGAADFRAFMSAHYRPERMVLAAAGAVNHDALVRLAETAFGHLDRAVGDAAPPPAAVFKGGAQNRTAPLEQAHVALAFEQPGYRDRAVYPARVFAVALGGGMSSRLFQELREKRGLCYAVSAQLSSYCDTGLLTIYSGTGEHDVAHLVEVTIDQLKHSATDMSEAEVARARAQIKAGMLMGLESPSARAERLAHMVRVWGRVPELSEAIEKIDAVDVAAVRAHAAALCNRARPALASHGPVAAMPDIGWIAERMCG